MTTRTTRYASEITLPVTTQWNRAYEQAIRDVGTSLTGPQYEWSCLWRWPNGQAETCAEGAAESAAHGARLVADHLATDHDLPAIPQQRPTR